MPESRVRFVLLSFRWDQSLRLACGLEEEEAVLLVVVV